MARSPGVRMRQRLYTTAADVLEEIAKMNFMTELINPNADNRTPQCMQDKHFFEAWSERVLRTEGVTKSVAVRMNCDKIDRKK